MQFVIMVFHDHTHLLFSVEGLMRNISVKVFLILPVDKEEI